MSLWDEIHEQPEALTRSLREGRPAVGEAAGLLAGPDVAYVLVAARGSSDNAARYAQYLWGARNRLVVALAAPALVSGPGPGLSLAGAAVMAFSQSGRSPDVVGVLEEGGRQGRPTIAVTNDPSSPLARAADVVVDLRVGPERSVAATKTYTGQLLAAAAISARLAGDREMESLLERVPGWVAEALSASDVVAGTVDAVGERGRCVVLGRGLHLATAFEWALKLQELCIVAALPYSTADFEHGPVAMAEPGLPVLAVAPAGRMQPDLIALLRRLGAERGIDPVVVSDDAGALALGRGIPLPAGVPGWASPIAGAAVAQLFCHHLASKLGLDPDAPRGLRKVTRTR
jgi:glutamine---fructose-6-phosphate transaminase (isomerizing)